MLKFLNYLALLTSLAIAGIGLLLDYRYGNYVCRCLHRYSSYDVSPRSRKTCNGRLSTSGMGKLNYLKYYLLASVGVLMLITSLGIFGYLSKANIETNLVGDGNNLELSILDVRIGAEEDKITRLQERLSGLDLVITTGRPQDRNYINRQQRDERESDRKRYR